MTKVVCHHLDRGLEHDVGYGGWLAVSTYASMEVHGQFTHPRRWRGYGLQATYGRVRPDGDRKNLVPREGRMERGNEITLKGVFKINNFSITLIRTMLSYPIRLWYYVGSTVLLKEGIPSGNNAFIETKTYSMYIVVNRMYRDLRYV